MIQQLNPTIPVVTPKGKGNAVGWIDYGAEDNLYWIVFQTDTCECWIYPNKDIRAQENLTLGRKVQEPANTQPPDLKGNASDLLALPHRVRALEASLQAVKNRLTAENSLRGDYSETLTTVPVGRPGK